VRAGKVVLIDISFPAWNPNFPNFDHGKIGYFRKLARLSSGIVVPESSYKVDLEHYIKDKPIKVIPNRLDLGLRLGKDELDRLRVLKELDVRQSAKEYMVLISAITGDKTIVGSVQKTHPFSKIPRLNNDLALSPQERLEELKKKSKLLLLVGPLIEMGR